VRRFDAATASCTVFTFREGLLSAVGHDLRLSLSKFAIDIADDDSIQASFDAASLRVTGAIADGDRRTIERQAADDVLAARRFPEIRFRSTRVRRNGSRAQIDGELTLHGHTRALQLDADDDGTQWTAEVTLDQRDYAIKPFSTMLGALRVRADVRVRVSLPSR
jgi:polyisoprenoid-binding protein YceI